jgi:lipopolysaccharide export system protein LptA
MSRLFHSAVSFAVVLAAYWIYVLVAVPLIEPTIAGPTGADSDIGFGEMDVDQSVKLLEGLFPPDAEILKNPIILENNKVKLLMKKYKNLGDGRVELHPCVMIFLWDGPAEDEAQRRRQSVILEAPKGAILKFDQPINLSSLRIGRLVGGSLLGDITIRSKGKLPGPEDDLLIITSDVQLNEKEAWTPNRVEFTWGKNSGAGRDMHIKLLAGPAKTGASIAAPNVAGVELFELRRIERLILQPSDTDNTPVEITCRGPFYFNVPNRVATFSDNVDIRRLNASGPSDQIQCELLSLYFAARDNSNPENENSSDLEPERIEARGRPVVINAPAQNLSGRGERLQYNIKTQLISLDGVPEAFLRQGPNEIHGRSLQYKSAGPNRLGSAFAQGPGWLKGQMADRPDQRLEVHFNDKLRLFPQDQNHVISLSGGSVLDYAGMGHMEADDIFFWRTFGPNALAARPHDGPKTSDSGLTAIFSRG